MGTPFKMKAGKEGPMKKNFGISPVKDKDKLRTRGVDKDGNKIAVGPGTKEYKERKKNTVVYQDGKKVIDNTNQENKEKPGNFKGISFDTFSRSK